MSETIQRGEHFYFRQPDGTWLRYNNATQAWEPSAPPPPPPPPAIGAPAAIVAGSGNEPNLYRGSGAVASAREIEGSAAPGYEWRATSARPVDSFGAAPLAASPRGLAAWRTPLLAIGVLAVIAVAGWFGYKMFFGPQTFSGEGVSFQYPRGWTEEQAPTGIASGFGLEWVVGFAPDEDPPQMGIVAGRFGTGFPGGAADLGRLRDQMRANLSQLARGTGMSIGAVRTARLGGLDALATSISVPVGGSPSTLRLFFLPDSAQDKLYMMGCLIGESERRAARAACKQMTDSFELQTA
ncbi:MAG TPA: hypothetical protein VHJ82_09420 [Actinomycetota bacterium]|nr:hypothetical protein [Actinomycetota bacterium]